MSDDAPRTVLLADAGAPPTVDVLPLGAVVGGFRLTAVIGAGGGGRVYAAEHRVLRRRAAIKVLHAHLAVEPEMLERFVREAKAVNRIAHPNIVDIQELGTLDDGRPYYVMELIEGTDLASELRRRGRLALHEALAIVTAVADALHAAHRAGIVHRDLKASNVLLGQVDGRPLVKLHDFGVAKLVELPPGEAPLTALGRRLGTPYAMAPEQLRGAVVDHRVDVYAMGVLVFQMVTGTYPFAADDAAELEAMHLSEPPPLASSRAPLPAALDAVIARCLAKEPAERYPDMPAVVAACRAAMLEEATERAALGLAIYVEAPDAGGDLDAADRTADQLDRIEAFLAAAGYELALQLGYGVVAVRAIADATPSPEVAAAETDLGALARIVGDDRARWRMVVHVERFTRRPGRALAGPLLRVSSWVTAVSPGETLTDAARARRPG